MLTTADIAYERSAFALALIERVLTIELVQWKPAARERFLRELVEGVKNPPRASSKPDPVLDARCTIWGAMADDLAEAVRSHLAKVEHRR